jgi:hypothetical protein
MEPKGLLGLTLDHIMIQLTPIHTLKTYLNGISAYISIFLASFHVFPSGSFSSGLLTKSLYVFLIPIKCVLCSVSHVLTITIFIVAPCILITLKFLSPTNAPLYYTYKMLKCTVKISHDCSYMFRSTWTIIREPIPNLVEIVSKNTSLNVQHCWLKVFQAVVCTVCGAVNGTQYTPQLETLFTNIAEHLTTYFFF